MKKKNKKLFVIVLAILILVIGGIILGISLNSNSKELTLSEKKWVEENKNSMIDIYIMNNKIIFLDVDGANHDHDFSTVAQLLKHGELGVGLEAG